MIRRERHLSKQERAVWLFLWPDQVTAVDCEVRLAEEAVKVHTNVKVAGAVENLLKAWDSLACQVTKLGNALE